MTDSAPDVNADRVAEKKRREERAAFMRDLVIAAIRSGKYNALSATLEARIAWDAIEAEAAKP